MHASRKKSKENTKRSIVEMNDEENRPPTAGPAPGAAAAVKSESNALGKRKAREAQQDEPEELLECMEVEAPEPTGAEGAGESSATPSRESARKTNASSGVRHAILRWRLLPFSRATSTCKPEDVRGSGLAGWRTTGTGAVLGERPRVSTRRRFWRSQESRLG